MGDPTYGKLYPSDARWYGFTTAGRTTTPVKRKGSPPSRRDRVRSVRHGVGWLQGGTGVPPVFRGPVHSPDRANRSVRVAGNGFKREREQAGGLPQIVRRSRSFRRWIYLRPSAPSAVQTISRSQAGHALLPFPRAELFLHDPGPRALHASVMAGEPGETRRCGVGTHGFTGRIKVEATEFGG